MQVFRNDLVSNVPNFHLQVFNAMHRIFNGELDHALLMYLLEP